MPSGSAPPSTTRRRDGHVPSLRRRLAWYVLGIGLVVAAVLVHPAADRELFLGPGDRLGAIVGGLVFGVIGTGQAVAFAWLRYRHFRCPPCRSYPGALLNAVATAFIDEAAFRGMLLGCIILAGLESTRRPRTSSRPSSTRSRRASGRPGETATCSSWPS